MNGITVSIITCTFNSEKYLRKALQSIENQSYLEIEHIINDAYSTDSTLDIIRNTLNGTKTGMPLNSFNRSPRGLATP